MNAGASDRRSFLANMQDVSFWKSLNPNLSITKNPLSGAICPAENDAKIVKESLLRVVTEGYFQAPPILSTEKSNRLSQVITSLVDRNIPPVFAFVYDEFWSIFGGANHILVALLGQGYRIATSDIWIWHVAKGPNASGWGPHRDLGTLETVRGDGRPTNLTLWVPLTDTTPLNGCMYALPTNLDPHVPNSLMDLSLTSEMLQGVRALPAEAGSVLGWNTHILHWGGRSSPWAKEPRISVAIYFQSDDFIPISEATIRALATKMALPFDARLELSFKDRLRAIAGAILQYRTMVNIEYPDISAALIEFSEKCVASHSVPPPTQNERIGRNQTCPCGSGKKYKQCHGR